VEVVEQCRTVKEFLSNDFVLRSCYSGTAYKYSYGVSLYFPWSDVASSYWNLDFVEDANGSGWGFYTALFKKGLPPAAALRDAQLELAKYPRWQSPYYWAGFVIQGQYEQKGQFTETPLSKFQIAVFAVLGSSLLVAFILFLQRRRRAASNA
jgi:hypothetical protein